MKLFKVIVISLMLVIVGASRASAQHLQFNQIAPDLATANAAAYLFTADANPTLIPLTGVTCTGTASPFVCTGNFPTSTFTTPGSHTLVLFTQMNFIMSAGSAVLPFQVPNAPTNLIIKQ